MTTMAQMEEVREIARLQYEIAGAEVKCQAVKFFSSLDSDGDGKVDIQELWSFMMEQGYPPHFRNLKFFSLLDSDGSGALTFDEVRTLFYIITTGRPCCSACSHFIAGTFFSCPDCPAFHLCLTCFRDAQPRHHVHGGRRVHFLDTCAFLQTLRSRQPTPSPPNIINAPVEYGSQLQQTGTSSRSLLVHQKTSKREVTYKALTLALAAAGVVADCSIL